jgi:2'-5' RNA ligase
MVDKPEKLRAFFAVEPPLDAKASVVAWQRKLARLLPSNAVRWTPEEQLHLTLLFLGNVEVRAVPVLVERVAGSLGGAEAPRVRLAGTGVFPSDRAPRIIWAGLAGDLPMLMDLQARIACAATGVGDARENRPFHAHLTLGRVARPTSELLRALRPWLVSGQPESASDWEIDTIRLMRSELQPAGAIYSELARFEIRSNSLS